MAELILKLLCAMIVTSLTSHFAHSAKILILATIGGSQYVRMRNVAEELGTRGHEVSLLVPSSMTVKKSEKFEHKVFQVPLQKDFMEKQAGNMIKNGFMAMIQGGGAQKLITVCECILNNTELHRDLQGFDLLVSDTMFCGPLLSELLEIPRVDLCPIPPRTGLVSFTRNFPAPPSYVPVMMSGNTDRMTFLQRVKNVLLYGIQSVAFSFILPMPFNSLKMKYNIKPERSFLQAAADYELVLISADFAMDYPQPLLPSSIMVGPLSIKKSKPLPADMEAFMSSSGEHGVVMVSFGTFVASNLEKQKVDLLAEAFGRLKQKVIWRLQGYIPSPLAANIRVVDWLPQSDLLAHPQTKVFVTHTGHNSQTEAAYRGMPVVMIPMFGDQFDNAEKGEQFGLGLKVDHNTVTADELFKIIERVLYEPRFKETATRVSRIMSDRKRLPLEEAADWIEFVHRHCGAHHLRAQVVNLSWYQYYLLDVFLFLFAIFGVVVMVTVKMCRCLCGCCCGKSGGKSKKE